MAQKPVPTIEDLRGRLAGCQHHINKLEGVRDVSDRVAQSFFMGRVGGSGRNIYRLNKQREKALDATIDRAKILCKLYAERDNLVNQIRDIEVGGPALREEKRIENNKILAQWFRAKRDRFILFGFHPTEQTVCTSRR